MRGFGTTRFPLGGSSQWVKLIAVCSLATAITLETGVARAGTYTVSGCRTSWAPDVHNTSGLFAMGAYDQCGQPNYDWLFASFGGGGRVNAGVYAGWRFD